MCTLRWRSINDICAALAYSDEDDIRRAGQEQRLDRAHAIQNYRHNITNKKKESTMQMTQYIHARVW